MSNISTIEMNGTVYDLEDSVARETKQNNLTPGDNIDITDDVISAVDTTYKEATTSEAGLMSASDKEALDGLVEEMPELKKSVSDGKSSIASAITGKGVTTAADATFETMASNIDKIKLASGNAAKGDVLSGKTFSNDNELGLTGTMPNNGAVSKTFTPSTSAQSYTVPAGYHNGSGKVTVNATPTQTKSATPSTSAQTISPDSGKFLSSVSVGAIPNQSAGGAKYATTSAQTLVTAPKYITSNITLGAISATNLAAANIKKGTTVTVSNGSSNIYSVAGTLAYTPHMADLQKRFPDRNYDYDVTWTVQYTGIVYFSWSFHSNGTSGWFIYRNGTQVSSERSGSFEVAMSAGGTIRWGCSGAHESSDGDGSIYMITMTVS